MLYEIEAHDLWEYLKVAFVLHSHGRSASLRYARSETGTPQLFVVNIKVHIYIYEGKNRIYSQKNTVMRNQKYLTLLKRFELSKNETVMGKPKYSGENHLTLLKRFELSKNEISCLKELLKNI